MPPTSDTVSAAGLVERKDLHELFEDTQRLKPFVANFPEEQVGYLLDAVLAISDEEPDGVFRSNCHSFLRKISRNKGVLPPLLYKSGVSSDDKYPIAGGGFADVYRGHYEGSPVALKVLRTFLREDDESDTETRKVRDPSWRATFEADSKHYKAFYREALAWRQIRYPYILPLLGIASDIFAPRPCMISPWMKNGDIVSYLIKNPSVDRHRLLLQVASAINYLHSQEPPMIHSDLKSNNILIDDSGNALLSDFGLLRAAETHGLVITTSAHSIGGGAAPVSWLAPELLSPPIEDGKSAKSTQTDVYAYGITCVEIFTCQRPFSSAHRDTALAFAIINGHRPKRPIHRACSDSIWKMMQACWEKDSSKRPTMRSVVHELFNISTVSKFNDTASNQSITGIDVYLATTLNITSTPGPAGAERFTPVAQSEFPMQKTHVTHAHSNAAVPTLPDAEHQSETWMRWLINHDTKRLTIPAHGRAIVTCLLFSHGRIISASEGDSINLHSATTGRLVYLLHGHEGGVWALAATKTTLVSGSTDKTIRIWDLTTGKCTHVFKGHKSTVRCLAIVKPEWIDVSVGNGTTERQKWPKQPLIVTGSRDRTLRVWRLPRRDEAKHPNYESDGPTHLKLLLEGHDHAIRALSAKGRTLVSGSYDHTVRIWDIITGEMRWRLQGHIQKVYDVVLDLARNQAYSSSLDGTIRIWSLATGQCLHILSGHTSLVGLLDLSTSYLVSAGVDSTLRVWNPDTGELRHTLAAHTGVVTCFHHDEFKVVSGSRGTLKLWNIQDGTVVRDLLTGITDVWQVVCKGQQCVAVSNRNGETMLDIWDFGKGREDKCGSGESGGGSDNEDSDDEMEYDEADAGAMDQELESSDRSS